MRPLYISSCRCGARTSSCWRWMAIAMMTIHIIVAHRHDVGVPSDFLFGDVDQNHSG